MLNSLSVQCDKTMLHKYFVNITIIPSVDVQIWQSKLQAVQQVLKKTASKH